MRVITDIRRVRRPTYNQHRDRQAMGWTHVGEGLFQKGEKIGWYDGRYTTGLQFRTERLDGVSTEKLTADAPKAPSAAEVKDLLNLIQNKFRENTP